MNILSQFWFVNFLGYFSQNLGYFSSNLLVTLYTLKRTAYYAMNTKNRQKVL
jgi:hypothetical protein